MFKETVEKYYPEMKAIREDIHRHPELSYKEERTSALIMEKLKEYGVDSVERTWMTGLVALIKGRQGRGQVHRHPRRYGRSACDRGDRR